MNEHLKPVSSESIKNKWNTFYFSFPVFIRLMAVPRTQSEVSKFKQLSDQNERVRSY